MMFGFLKKEEKKKTCSCGTCTPAATERAEQGRPGGIKVLGGGCAKCHELEANAKAALAELGSGENVELITDFSVIAAYGVMSLPALVVDGKVVSSGKVLKTREVKEAIGKARG